MDSMPPGEYDPPPANIELHPGGCEYVEACTIEGRIIPYVHQNNPVEMCGSANRCCDEPYEGRQVCIYFLIENWEKD